MKYIIIIILIIPFFLFAISQIKQHYSNKKYLKNRSKECIEQLDKINQYNFERNYKIFLEMHKIEHSKESKKKFKSIYEKCKRNKT